MCSLLVNSRSLIRSWLEHWLECSVTNNRDAACLVVLVDMLWMDVLTVITSTFILLRCCQSESPLFCVFNLLTIHFAPVPSQDYCRASWIHGEPVLFAQIQIIILYHKWKITIWLFMTCSNNLPSLKLTHHLHNWSMKLHALFK